MQHHAHLLISTPEVFLSHAEAILGEQGIAIKGNPDVAVYTFASLGVDDARAIKEAAYRTASAPWAQSWQVLYVGNATHEAQNALLKVLEEPPKDTYFLIGVPHQELLLPTVRSRLLRLDRAQQSEAGAALDESVSQKLSGNVESELVPIPREQEDVVRFVEAPLAERLRIVRPYFEDKEPIPSTHAFLDALEHHGAARLRASKTDTAAREMIRDVISARTFLYGRSPSKKLLLENLALRLPGER
jgi:hypothetical protein